MASSKAAARARPLAVTVATICFCLAALLFGLVAGLNFHSEANQGTSLTMGRWPELRDLATLQGITAAAHEFWAIIGPGGKLHPAYFLENKGHLVVEGVLLAVIAYLFLQNSFKPHTHDPEVLTEKEVDYLCKEWKPEPLTPPLATEDKVNPRVISSYEGKHVVADGVKALNLATYDFLGLKDSKQQLNVAAATVEKYGVGSCGPRGFYGTIDVHLKLEDELSRFMRCPEAIIYSYDIATITSIIPAFANRKDIIVLDECCSFGIQQGAILSRASLYWFKHNDMEDLERVLREVERKNSKEKRPLCRKLIVVEGIYANTGELAPLDSLYKIKEKYKYRLVLEESHSFGVLGKTGRGATEHWGLTMDQVEIVCASMGNSLASVGGFCVGTEEIVEHQRLSGSGYCFSASLPPYLATAASETLRQLEVDGPERISKLQANAQALRRQLSSIPGLSVVGNQDVSPLIHLRLANPPSPRRAAEKLLQKIADNALQAGVLVTVQLYSNLDRTPPPPSLCVLASARLTAADIDHTAAVLKSAVKQAL